MKEQSVFVCASCGNEFLKWEGRCAVCGEWNTLKEVQFSKAKFQKEKTKPAEIMAIEQVDVRNFQRLPTGISEVDRVLGGGLVPGSVVLLAGDPGIGKSTLLLQVAQTINQPVLYIAGEESPHQIKLRYDRLLSKNSQLKILAETDLENILAVLDQDPSSLIIVDSIQTLYDPHFPSTAGSLVQVKECALKLLDFAKGTNKTVVLVGHITKEGVAAGPKILEHMVDLVLYLEGERYHGTRILRGIKNRFGPTSEIGIFEMSPTGLAPILNPSKLFLSERLSNVPGSAVTATMEGTRPFLVEVQALVNPTSFGYPKRTALGFDLNRLMLLLAVLEKRARLPLSSFDVYVNIVGGLKIKEPASDLAISTAVAGAKLGKITSPEFCLFGEIGLSGEIRAVSHSKERIKEAKRLGFTRFNRAKTLEQAINDTLS
ncbi:DNA repair protein RadA [Candidatus Berkelbacteria bacterium]|nr:DNA repair protein RadA [Candidatus Berkelbacteria bacterium]MBI2588377.1 DNA repair protein RadA [Candidatus Berkelbacteria bacterium]MBI4029567.1 DNA repair protein RadA [Candidatus Berkelbacteria bacterium]